MSVPDPKLILDAILRNSQTVIYVKDLEGRYTLVNPEWETVTGTSAADALGRTDAELFGTEMSDLAAIFRDNDLRAQRELVRVDERFDQPDGPHLFDSMKFPLRDGDDAVIATCGLSVDVTAERGRREALDEAQRIANIGSWSWNTTIDEATWSPEMYRIFGRDPADGPATADAFFAYVHPDDRDAIAAGYLQTFGGGPSFELDYRITAGDGERKTLHSVGRQAPGRPGVYVGVVQDVTGLRAVERALQRSNRDLEHFGSVVSHDLGEPLRTVRGFAELLAARHGDQLDGAALEFLRLIVSGTERMSELLAGLLAYSRAGSGDLAVGSVDVQSLVEDVVAGLGAIVESSAARIEATGLPTLQGDTTQLHQIFQNLVGNAIKFSGDQPPDIRISAERMTAEWMFHIEDDGIGITEGAADQAFEIFQQLEPAGTHEGLGLGLAITKRLVERRGGRVWLAPRAGGGTVASFTIPDRVPPA